MDISIAQYVFAGIATVEFLVWLIAYQLIRWTSVQTTPSSAQEHLGNLESFSPDFYYGSLEVEGDSHSLMERAASLLVRDGTSSLGTIKIIERTPRSLTFEKVAGWGGNLARYQGFKRGILRSSDQGGDTRIDYALDFSPLRTLLRTAQILNLIGFVVLVVAGVLLYNFVVTSNNPAIRWQTIQMIQVGHLLWPPFLFLGIYRRVRAEAIAQFDAFVHNLPHYQLSP